MSIEPINYSFIQALEASSWRFLETNCRESSHLLFLNYSISQQSLNLLIKALIIFFPALAVTDTRFRERSLWSLVQQLERIAGGSQEIEGAGTD